MSNTTNQLTVFLDNIGRTIVGKVIDETESVISVENPALIHIQANPQTSQLQLQILPLFFREFQADKTKPTVWLYKKANVTLSQNIPFAPQFTAQYEQMFRVEEPSSKKEPEVVKLFDE